MTWCASMKKKAAATGTHNRSQEIPNSISCPHTFFETLTKSHIIYASDLTALAARLPIKGILK